MTRFRALALAGLAILATCHAGWTQDYPRGPVRVVVPDGASTMDAVGRIFADQMTKQTGQTFFVENHPGRSGETGTELVVRAPPDGYTLLMIANNLSLFPNVTRNLPFDVHNDLAPVAMIGALAGSFLIASNDFPARNLQELIAYARDPKNILKFGHSGLGGAAYLRMAVLAKSENFPFAQTEYKSPGEQNNAVISGEAQIAYALAPSAAPLIKAGKVRAIAYDNPTRNPDLPDVPTLVESGAAPGKVGNSWEGLFAPAKTPQPIVDWLAAEVKKAVEDPATAQKLKAINVFPVGGPQEMMRQTLAKDVAGMREALEIAGVTAK